MVVFLKYFMLSGEYDLNEFKCERLGLETLANRRRDACALFAFYILSSRINFPTILLSLIGFNALRRR